MMYIHVSSKDRSKVKSQLDNLRMAGVWERIRWRSSTEGCICEPGLDVLPIWKDIRTMFGCTTLSEMANTNEVKNDIC